MNGDYVNRGNTNINEDMIGCSGNNFEVTVTYNGRTSRLSSFYHISKHKNLAQKYFDNSLTGFS